MSISNEFQSKLYDLLVQIQLENFWPLLRDDLQITQISHFDYVKVKDLEKIGMSKPAARRLLDSISKYKKQRLKDKFPVRPPPPPPPSHTPPSTSSSSSETSVQRVTSFSYTTNGSTSNSFRFNPDQPNGSKLYNSNITKTILTSKILNSANKKQNVDDSKKNKIDSPKSNLDDSFSSQPVSVLINPNDIQIIKNNKGEDDVIGFGHFGIVKRAIWTTHTGSKITVAVKCLHDNLIDSTNVNNQDKQQAFADLINEISCMCGLNNKNLIKLYGIILNSQQVHTTNSKSILMMVTELAPYGSLLNYLRKKRENSKLMHISKLYSYIYQITCGMEYLEFKKLIHRDLACRNILLFTIDQIKICDFGMTRSVKHDGSYTMTETHKIPCAWYPPESIREKLFSIKSDVWMFGVTVWEIFTLGQQPWPNMNAIEILNMIDNESKQLPLPSACSKEFYSIIQKCWSKSPNERPSFQILRKLVRETKIIEMKAKDNFKQESKLEIEKGDMITIIEGNADRYWWKGQNNRTLLVGHFPRAILDPQRPISGADISLPLKNSFIHTGHMSAGLRDKMWGNPGTIDPIFLNNPLNPPDLLDVSNADYETSNTNKNELPVKIIDSLISEHTNNTNTNNNHNKNNNNLIDLIELNTNDMQITYPDYSVSIDSFASSKSPSPSSQSSSHNNVPIVFNTSSSSPLYMNENYHHQNSYETEHYNATTTTSTNAISSKSDESKIYYNDLPKVILSDMAYSTNEFNFTNNYDESNQIANNLTTHIAHSVPSSSKNSPILAKQNLTSANQNFLSNSTNQSNINSNYETNRTNNKLINLNSQIKNNNFNKFNFTNQINDSLENTTNNTKINVDDYLNKVMNDVMNDFKNVKFINTNNKVK